MPIFPGDWRHASSSEQVQTGDRTRLAQKAATKIFNNQDELWFPVATSQYKGPPSIPPSPVILKSKGQQRQGHTTAVTLVFGTGLLSLIAFVVLLRILGKIISSLVLANQRNAVIIARS